eukprot:4450664-Alexandrium_andersonii.AAC.1
MLDTPAFTGPLVAKLRQQAAVAPPVPAQAVVRSLQDIEVWEDAPASARPEWLSPLCWNREVFHKAALVFESEGRRQYFKVLYALQKPLFACCSQLQPLEQHPLMLPVNR